MTILLFSYHDFWRFVMPVEDEQVLGALRTVKGPELFKDITTLGRVKEFQVDNTTVRFRLDLGKTSGPAKQAIERDLKEALRKIGIQAVEIQDVGAAVAAAS